MTRRIWRSDSSMAMRPAASAIGATPFGVRASKSSWIRGRPWVMSSPPPAETAPPVWKVRMVSWVPGAGADAGLTGEYGADLDLGDAGREQLGNDNVAAVSTGRCQDLALGVDDVHGQGAGVGAVLDVLVQDQLAVGVSHSDRGDEAAFGAAVLFTDDDVLRDVHQTTGQVTRVGGTQGGIGQTLTGTVRGDEVFQHRQALAVGGLDRARDDLALRVGHQATDTRDLADLHPVTTGTAGHHAVDGVHRRQAVTHRLGDLVGCLVPDLDQFLATLVVVDQALVVLALDLRGHGLVAGQQFRLGGRNLDVGDGDGDARAGGPVETGILQVVQRCRGDDLRVALGEVVDDPGQFALVGNSLNPGVVLGQGLVEEDLAQGGLDECGLTLLPAFGSFPAGVGDKVLEPDLDLGVQVQLVQVERHDGFRNGGEDPAFAS